MSAAVCVSVAATGPDAENRANLEHQPTLCVDMTPRYASNDLRMSGKSLRLDAAAAKRYADGREESDGS
jgi:hypothetical protein